MSGKKPVRFAGTLIPILAMVVLLSTLQAYAQTTVVVPASSTSGLAKSGWPGVEKSVRVVYPAEGEVTAENVLLRAGSSLNYYVCGRLSKGSKVVVHEHRYGFLKVDPPKGCFSLIATDYVKVPKDSDEGVVTGTVVRVRAGAIDSEKIYAIQCKLNTDDKVHILGTVTYELTGKKQNFYKIDPPEELKGIAEAVVDKDIIIFSDEIYEHLVYGDQKFVSFAKLADGLMEKTVTFNSLSKTYSMTGWRIGYAAGPQEIISAMGRLQSHETSNPVTFCMHAAIAALKGDQDCVRQMRDEFAKRAEHMWKRLNAIKGISCIKPTGAFYCFANVSGCYDKLGVNGSAAFADAVLDKANVALVPGVAFGWDTHVRLSFATSMEQIDKGLDRLAELLA